MKNIFKTNTNINTQNTKESDSFQSIISLAVEILNSPYPNRIYDLIYTLGKPKQFQRILDCMNGQKEDNHDADEEQLFIQGHPSEHNYHFNKPDNIKFGERFYYDLDPSKYLVFTYPWNQVRLTNAFLDVGEIVGNKWAHDPANHQMTLIYPLNIGLIFNGNHSAAMNIISNESSFKVTQILDLSSVYTEIYSDGLNFIYRLDDSIIGKATSVEMAAVFEIGRLIIEHSLTSSKHNISLTLA